MKIVKANKFFWGNQIASNSLSVSDGDALALSWGYVVKATDTTGAVIWLAAGEQSFDADNETVAGKRVEFIELNEHMTFRTAIVWGAVTQANVWDKFNLNASSTVDGLTAWTGTQVELVEFLTATESVFKVV